MVTAILQQLQAEMPEDCFLADCLAIPLEPDHQAFPVYLPPHNNCACDKCMDCRRRQIRERADLVRQHIAAGRQHLLV